MRISLPADLFTTAFESRMALQNQHIIAARAGTSSLSTLTTPSSHGTSTSNGSLNHNRTGSTSSGSNNDVMVHQRPVVDLLVAMVAIPILILCALQLEKNLQDMANSPESRWLVFALIIGMLVVSIIIIGYVTHRMGVCIWTGPIDEAGNRTNGRSMSRINTQNDILRIVDSLPPSYDSVVKFDIPPPPYDCVVIDLEQNKEEEPKTSAGKVLPPTATVLHM